MSLKEKFVKILNEYRDIYNKVWSSGEFRDPLLDYFNYDVKNEIQTIVQKYRPELVLDSSTGTGRTTVTPWIAIMDKRITTKASQGTYVVYLFNKDLKTIYLALGRSSTELEKKIEELGFSGREKTAKIQENVQKEKREILISLDTRSFSTDDNVDSGKKEFDQTVIAYKIYSWDSMPDDNQLEIDLKEMLIVYSDYADLFLSHGEKVINVSRDVHDHGIFDSWEIISDSIARKTCDTSFFKYNGSGVPKEIRWFWDSDNLQNGTRKKLSFRYKGDLYSAHVERESSALGRTRLFWETNLGKRFDAFSVSVK